MDIISPDQCLLDGLHLKRGVDFEGEGVLNRKECYSQVEGLFLT